MYPRIIEIVLVSFSSGILSYGVAAFCHEAGHLLAGKWNQCIFLMLRVGRFVWVAGSLRCFICRESFLSPGQCVLLCSNKKGCCRAALGGCIANFVAAGMSMITGGVCASFCRGNWQESFCFYDLWISFTAISVLMAIVNMLPLSFLTGEISDGELWGMLRRDHRIWEEFIKEQRRCQFLLEEGQVAELLG